MNRNLEKLSWHRQKPTPELTPSGSQSLKSLTAAMYAEPRYGLQDTLSLRGLSFYTRLDPLYQLGRISLLMYLLKENNELRRKYQMTEEKLKHIEETRKRLIAESILDNFNAAILTVLSDANNMAGTNLVELKDKIKPILEKLDLQFDEESFTLKMMKLSKAGLLDIFEKDKRVNSSALANFVLDKLTHKENE